MKLARAALLAGAAFSLSATALAQAVFGGPTGTLNPSNDWAWNGSFLTAFRSALQSPVRFGPAGTVNTSITTSNLTTINAGTLAPLDVFVTGWWPDASSASSQTALITWFLNGGNLLLTQDDSVHDGVGAALGIPSFTSSGSASTGNAPLFEGPFGSGDGATQCGNVGRLLEAEDVLATGGTVGGRNAQNEVTVAYWNPGDYAPGAGAMVIIADVDMISTYCNANHYATNTANARLALNVAAFLATATVADADGDGVPDEQDVCPGGDDASDADGDQTPDACDVCPVDASNDSDGDGSCDSADPCPLDAADDADFDGLCEDADACAWDIDNDIDGDGVCGDVDVCPEDPANDADGDGVCGNHDACAGYDDNQDADADGAADGCDVCPFDAANDADSDGLCADADVCPLDADNDADLDGLCADLDVCPFDALNDGDADGICGDADLCPVDFANDADADGLCETIDNCDNTANAGQSDIDGDGIGDACDPDNDNDGVPDVSDNCVYTANPDQIDADGDGAGNACDTDDDGDAVQDADDACPVTAQGAVVDSRGCSIAQLCPCENGWKNHGAFVSCTAQTSESFVSAGLITGAQKDAIVSAAGSSSCGSKK